jgi:hypothetical protein
MGRRFFIDTGGPKTEKKNVESKSSAVVMTPQTIETHSTALGLAL